MVSVRRMCVASVIVTPVTVSPEPPTTTVKALAAGVMPVFRPEAASVKVRSMCVPGRSVAEDAYTGGVVSYFQLAVVAAVLVFVTLSIVSTVAV